jgi:hypothetical protein
VLRNFGARERRGNMCLHSRGRLRRLLVNRTIQAEKAQLRRRSCLRVQRRHKESPGHMSDTRSREDSQNGGRQWPSGRATSATGWWVVCKRGLVNRGYLEVE